MIILLIESGPLGYTQMLEFASPHPHLVGVTKMNICRNVGLAVPCHVEITLPVPTPDDLRDYANPRR